MVPKTEAAARFTPLSLKLRHDAREKPNPHVQSTVTNDLSEYPLKDSSFHLLTSILVSITLTSSMSSRIPLTSFGHPHHQTCSNFTNITFKKIQHLIYMIKGPLVTYLLIALNYPLYKVQSHNTLIIKREVRNCLDGLGMVLGNISVMA